MRDNEFDRYCISFIDWKSVPLNKSGQSFLVWFNDSNYFTVDVSESCSSLLLENIDMVLNEMFNVSYLKRFLGPCQNGIVILYKFCDPNVTYNTRLIEHNAIPYFSDVNIYFIDKDNLCTSSFKAFVETYNNVIRNKDIYRFLTNQTNFLDKIFFTNQINIEFSLQSISNTQSIIHANLYAHTYAIHIYFIPKYQTCKEQFIHSLYMNGFHVSKDDKVVLSFDNLMNLTHENACYETYLACSAWDRYQNVFVLLPHSTIVYVTSTVALAVILVNGFVLSIFIQKENRTPVTVLLSALAIYDSMTALLMNVLTLIAYQKYGHHVHTYDEGQRWFLLDISECLLHIVTYGLIHSFHFVSILLTTLLCLQKTVALLFPMWSKSHIRNRRNAIFSITIFIFCFCIFTALISVEKPAFTEPINGRCCIDLEYVNHGYDVNLYLYTIVTGCTVLACLVVIVCTIYITCKLTIMRRNLPWTDSSIIHKRNRTSALTVVVICIIFLLSEAVFVVRNLAYFLHQFEISIEWQVFNKLEKYIEICLVIGFALNFVIYLVMSRQIRDKLRIGFLKLLQSFKCW
ncbi:unnamed protein product [Mytilus edulis]|uniref:G-protein coupled receptors family 1 profile domain-containing protein n=1 Tax=Mytilus edulis TaxID=6550 RepID=A0A8S3VAX1_MYTED|nr:unnamed protein product [Mytilus edulis]